MDLKKTHSGRDDVELNWLYLGTTEQCVGTLCYFVFFVTQHLQMYGCSCAHWYLHLFLEHTFKFFIYTSTHLHCPTIQMHVSDCQENNTLDTYDAQPYKSIGRPCPVSFGTDINIHILHNWKQHRHMGTAFEYEYSSHFIFCFFKFRLAKR